MPYVQTVVLKAPTELPTRASLYGSDTWRPILRGRGFDDLSVDILPGGSDRQLLSPDEIKELDAVYGMRARDGTIISVRNRVVVDETCQPERYAMSVISTSVEDGPFGWLNRRILIGTLQSARLTVRLSSLGRGGLKSQLHELKPIWLVRLAR